MPKSLTSSNGAQAGKVGVQKKIRAPDKLKKCPYWPDCSYTTTKTSNMTRHLSTPKHRQVVDGGNKRRRVTRKLLKCPYCSFTTIWLSNLKRHLVKHRDINRGSSGVTKSVKPSKNPDYVYISRLMKECPSCSYATIFSYALTRHLASCKYRHLKKSLGAAKSRDLQVVNGGNKWRRVARKLLKCPYCSFTTTWHSTSKRHLTTHRDVDQGSSGVTKSIEASGNDDDLLVSGNVKMPNQPHQCPYCSYASTRPYDLKRHLASLKHRDVDKGSSGVTKSFEASGNDDLLVSGNVKMPNKPQQKYQCPYCSYAPTRYSYLIKHLASLKHRDIDKESSGVKKSVNATTENEDVEGKGTNSPGHSDVSVMVSVPEPLSRKSADMGVSPPLIEVQSGENAGGPTGSDNDAAAANRKSLKQEPRLPTRTNRKSGDGDVISRGDKYLGQDNQFNVRRIHLKTLSSTSNTQEMVRFTTTSGKQPYACRECRCRFSRRDQRNAHLQSHANDINPYISPPTDRQRLRHNKRSPLPLPRKTKGAARPVDQALTISQVVLHRGVGFDIHRSQTSTTNVLCNPILTF